MTQKELRAKGGGRREAARQAAAQSVMWHGARVTQTYYGAAGGAGAREKTGASSTADEPRGLSGNTKGSEGYGEVTQGSLQRLCCLLGDLRQHVLGALGPPGTVRPPPTPQPSPAPSPSPQPSPLAPTRALTPAPTRAPARQLSRARCGRARGTSARSRAWSTWARPPRTRTPFPASPNPNPDPSPDPNPDPSPDPILDPNPDPLP